jgi:Flp pilus assembly protein TadD
MIDVTDRSRLLELHAAADRAGARELDPDVLLSCATAALRARTFDVAQSILEASLVVDPDHPRAWALMGIVLERTGREDDARAAYETAISLDDQDFVTALSLAQIYARHGDRDRARSLVLWLISEIEDAPEIRKRAVELRRAIDEVVS